MSDKNKFFVAVKDVSSGSICQGKILGKYRKLEFAQRDRGKLARSAFVQIWVVGIFQNGKLVG